MNIFYLDKDIHKSVQYLVDKHVVKMPLETAQLLCSAAIINGGVAPYKLTHAKHPCTIWTTNSLGNFQWLREYGIALCAEYTHRYGKVHKCEQIIKNLVAANFANRNFYDPPQCMPDIYKNDDTVQAYRNYYSQGKSHLFKWSGRDRPEWINGPIAQWIEQEVSNL